MAKREDLETQVSAARKRIFRDGYDMSFGEIASLYERGELVVAPEYQRLFRWDAGKKTRFIESVLLNIPIPPIFVFAREEGTWELVDGLQRVSTILEFMGLLRSPTKKLQPQFVCDGTALLPSLQGMRWKDNGAGSAYVLPLPLQTALRRSRIRVEILGQETDTNVKYELFQRLNTGGASLTEQEIRNVIIISIDRSVFEHVSQMAKYPSFVTLTPVGQQRVRAQYRLELVVRFLVLRNFPYRNGMDVHDYLDQGIINVCGDPDFDWDAEIEAFQATMDTLLRAVGPDAFKKSARFSLAFFEFITLGLSRSLEERDPPLTPKQIANRVAGIGALKEADKYSGMGVRGTQRLAGLVMPLAEKHFMA